jgi:hypothetical protein
MSPDSTLTTSRSRWPPRPALPWPPNCSSSANGFTTARPTVIAELHTFLGAEAVHPAIALGWFTDSLAFATYHPEPGE